MNRSFPIALAALLALPGCKRTETPPTTTTTPSAISISAWIRLPARPDLPASGYFDATGEGEVGRLVSVSAANARIEMHESMAKHGMSSMQPIGPVQFDHGKIAFAPGGKHLMIYGLPPGLKGGDTLPLTFRFEKMGPIPATADMVGAGDPAPDDDG